MNTISDEINTDTAPGALDTRTLLAAVGSAEFGAWAADARGMLTYVAPGFLQLLGRSANEVLGERWAQWLAPEVQNLNLLSWRTAIEAGDPFERFHAYIASTGERRTIWVRANPILGSDGRIEGWAGLHLLPPFPATQTPPSGNAVERFLESTTEGFIALDLDFRFTYVNRIAAEMMQSAQEKLLGQNHWDLFPSLVGTQVEREYRRALAENEAIHFEYHVESVELWLDIHVYPTEQGLSVYFRDISRRRKAESRLNVALRGARAGIWEWELASDIMTWSPEMFELLQADPALSPSRDLFMALLVPEDRGPLYTAVVVAFDHTSEMAIELRLAAGNRWVALTGRVIRDSAGKAIRMVGLGQDITERRQAEEALRATQNSLALAMQGGRMGYWTRRLEPDVVTWSPELEELFGLERGSFDGDESQFLKFVLEEDVHLVTNAVQSAIRTGQDYSVEFRFRRLDGAIRWMEGRGRASYDSQGKATWLHGIGIDITERKEGEARYRRLAEYVPCIVWSTDPDGVTHFVNRRWMEVTGRTSPTLTREDWAHVIHAEDKARIHQQWEIAQAENLTYDAEVRYRTLDGTYRWFLERAEPVVGDDGRIVEWFGTSVDIDDLRRTEESMRQLLNSMPQLAWSVGSDGRLEFINRRYLEYTGMENGFDTNSSWANVVHEEDRVLIRDAYAEAISNGTGWEAEMRLRRKDGEYRWHLSRLVPIRDASGQIQRWFGASADIHAQKTKEQFLDFLVRLSEASRWLDAPEEIVLTTVTMLGKHLSASRVAYEEVSEGGESFTVGFEFLDGVESSLGTFSFDALDYEPLCAGETVVSQGDGAFIRAPIVRAGRLLSMLRVEQVDARDWTDDDIRLTEMVAERLWGNYVRARSDQDLRDLNAELEQRVDERTAALMDANREMEGFTYTVSHDLRAPLRAITATSMILLEEAGQKLAEEERSLLQRQAHNAKYLGVLIDELLRLSRLSRQEMVMLPFDMSNLADTIIDEISADGRNGCVRFEVQRGMQAVGDTKLMSFVLLNLLENAAKFSPEGGVVRVGQKDGIFFVSDEGIGFDPTYSDKLFRPFERLVSQTEFPGTGIGLANVKRIVERHSGTVWAESRPGEGATFWFTLGVADRSN